MCGKNTKVVACRRSTGCTPICSSLVRHGGFLQAGDQAIAIALQVDKEHGQAIVSATRQPNTSGASGTGTIMGIAIKALAPGTSNLSIVQVSARDSQQRPIQLVTGDANVQVKP
jgi:general secretion pathway protein D